MINLKFRKENSKKILNLRRWWISVRKNPPEKVFSTKAKKINAIRFKLIFYQLLMKIANLKMLIDYMPFYINLYLF